MPDERDKDKRGFEKFERREGAPRPPFEIGGRNVAYQPPSRQPHEQLMEPRTNSTTKFIVIFALGVAAGFAASQMLLSDRLNNDNKTNDRTREVASGVDEAAPNSDSPSLPVPADNAAALKEKRTSTPRLNIEIASGPSAITIENQPSGSAVEVKRLVLGDRSWVVVHEDERGRPGRILGAGRFMAGVHTDVSVELLRSTEPGGVYYGMIHIDDGDETFDQKLDTHLPDESGSPIMVRFSAL